MHLAASLRIIQLEKVIAYWKQLIHSRARRRVIRITVTPSDLVGVTGSITLAMTSRHIDHPRQ